MNNNVYWIAVLRNVKVSMDVLGFCFANGIYVKHKPDCTGWFHLSIKQGDTIMFCDADGYCTDERYEINGIDMLNRIVELMKTRFALSQLEHM